MLALKVSRARARTLNPAGELQVDALVTLVHVRPGALSESFLVQLFSNLKFFS